MTSTLGVALRAKLARSELIDRKMCRLAAIAIPTDLVDVKGALD